MAILVFNAGSSSLKFGWYATGPDLRLHINGKIDGFGEHAKWHWKATTSERGHTPILNHWEAAKWVLDRFRAERHSLQAVGHRIVHGGDLFRAPTLLTDNILVHLAALNALAPLHNPPGLDVIHACRDTLGDTLPMVAVFDTAFHTTLPERAYRYALPSTWERAHGIRRYGFHGIAHRYLYERYRELDPNTATEPRVISFQLGNGCSVAAIRDGRSLDTSMGYTPLEGLIMSTRCGDLDPGVILKLAQHQDSAALSHDLNYASGLLGLSGLSSDMRELLRQAASGHQDAERAIDSFCYRARKYLGAYLAVLGGADAILFGGGIGENAPEIRARICADMSWSGLHLDHEANTSAVGSEQRISLLHVRPAAYVIPVDEELLIARDTRALLAR